MLGQPLSSLVFGWLWRKGNSFKLKGCSCFSPDSICYLINLIVCGLLFPIGQAGMMTDESWCSAAVPQTPAHSAEVTGISVNFRERDKVHSFGKESELQPFTLGKAEQSK